MFVGPYLSRRARAGIPGLSGQPARKAAARPRSLAPGPPQRRARGPPSPLSVLSWPRPRGAPKNYSWLLLMEKTNIKGKKDNVDSRPVQITRKLSGNIVKGHDLEYVIESK